MDTTIGGKRFPAFGFGKLQNESTYNAGERITNASGSSNLTALTGSATFAALLPISTNLKVVKVLYVTVYAEFRDSGAGTYNVSTLTSFAINAPGNLDTNTVLSYPNHFANNPINAEMNVNSSGELSLTVGIFGGDVVRATGITPGAGDTVFFSVSVSYLG